MSYEIVGGSSQRFYHTVPSKLDMITTTPTREGIFKYLSQIGHDKFPEFVLDVLTKIEGHKQGDVTDGQGDEKQDIITVDSSGDRCLTQCKHTIHYDSHYNGDELDLLVAASMRKNCHKVLFVTNSDLTPQGKRYVTDGEYNRGFSNASDFRTIEYWNGYKIWDKIKTNPDIINKWFSGLGQVHGLRTFKFDLTVQKMPFDPNENSPADHFEELVTLLKTQGWFQNADGDEPTMSISEKYQVKMKKWFQFSSALDIDFVLPNAEKSFVNRPMYALSIDVTMNTNEKYSPSFVREEIVSRISDSVLHAMNEKWWHMTASPIISFIYLHDITEPREVKLAGAATFVKVMDNTIREIAHCDLSSDDYDFDGESSWTHKSTGVQVVQSFYQQLDPVEVYNNQIAQYRDLERMASFRFFRVSPVAPELMMRIRRLLKKDWIALQHNNDGFIWGFDADTDADEIAYYHSRVSLLNLTVREVNPGDVTTILSAVQKDIPPPKWAYINELSDISFPIQFESRMFWLSKDLVIPAIINVDEAMALAQYKYLLEQRFGFDNMDGRTVEHMHSSELPSLLFDFLTFRGERMLDIGGIQTTTISINMRFREGMIASSANLIERYIQEFLTVYVEIENLLMRD